MSKKKKKKKKRQRIYDLLNAKTKPKFLSAVYKAKKKFTETELYQDKGGVEDWLQNEKKTI